MSKGLNRLGRVLQNPDTRVQIPPSPLSNNRQYQATPVNSLRASVSLSLRDVYSFETLGHHDVDKTDQR